MNRQAYFAGAHLLVDGESIPLRLEQRDDRLDTAVDVFDAHAKMFDRDGWDLQPIMDEGTPEPQPADGEFMLSRHYTTGNASLHLFVIVVDTGEPEQ